MFSIRWFWKDGTMSEYKLNTKEDAEMMAIQLYMNPEITNVIISDK